MMFNRLKLGYALPFFLLSCSMHRTSMKGTVDVVEDDWVSVEVNSANNVKTWVKLNRKQLRSLKEGDKVIFYVRVETEGE